MNFATIFFPNLSQILCYGLESILPHGAEAEKCHISSSSSTRSHAMDKFDRFSLFQTNMHTHVLPELCFSKAMLPSVRMYKPLQVTLFSPKQFLLQSS